VVKKVKYENKSIAYETFDPDATEVLRLNNAPAHIKAGGHDLPRVDIVKQDGYTLRKLPAGGVVVHVHHKGASDVIVSW
jgi:uncharacterized protein YjlB